MDDMSVQKNTCTYTGSDCQIDGIVEISVKSLDLNCDFKEIRTQLDGIVTKYFGEEQ